MLMITIALYAAIISSMLVASIFGIIYVQQAIAQGNQSSANNTSGGNQTGGNMTGAGLASSGTTTGGGSAASRNLTTK